VKLGFVAFVEASADGYLFLNAKTKEAAKGRLQALKNRMTQFVRTIVTDPRVQPNHGWRHRFITLARRYGMDQEIRRMITGHAGKGVDERIYGDAEGLYREICKLPCYELMPRMQLSALAS
jgi:integrase